MTVEAVIYNMYANVISLKTLSDLSLKLKLPFINIFTAAFLLIKANKCTIIVSVYFILSASSSDGGGFQLIYCRTSIYVVVSVSVLYVNVFAHIFRNKINQY